MVDSAKKAYPAWIPGLAVSRWGRSHTHLEDLDIDIGTVNYTYPLTTGDSSLLPKAWVGEPLAGEGYYTPPVKLTDAGVQGVKAIIAKKVKDLKDGDLVVMSCDQNSFQQHPKNHWTYPSRNLASSPAITYNSVSISKVVKVTKCSRCGAVLKARNSSHFDTIQCRIVDEHKDLELAGYVSWYEGRYEANRRASKEIMMYGHKIDSCGGIWIPKQIADACKQYNDLVENGSDILNIANPGAKRKNMTLGQWISKIGGGAQDTSRAQVGCSMPGCKASVSSAQPTIKYGAAIYEMCDAHGPKFVTILTEFLNAPETTITV